MRQNIELKARIADLDTVRKAAEDLATGRLEDQHQTDTYFRCAKGRLKLREIDGQQAQLIWYERPDQSDAKTSNYQLTPIEDAAGLKFALSNSLGVRVVVEKYREILLYHNVRIHLDRVVDLGTFLEFEAVLGEGADTADGHAKVAWLRQQLKIADSDLIEGSYAELRS